MAQTNVRYYYSADSLVRSRLAAEIIMPDNNVSIII